MKTAWDTGRVGDKHAYIWVYSPRTGLVITDRYEWHSEFFDDWTPRDENHPKSCRGLVVVWPKKKIGYVFSYNNVSHEDAHFIDNNVWNSIQARFPGYRLEEKTGLADACTGRGQTFVENLRLQASSKIQNPLLKYSMVKHAGTLRQEDLDVYDSELLRDLLELHDQILNNPVRNFDAFNPLSLRRYFKYTYDSLRNRLYPAIEKTLPKLPRATQNDVRSCLADAIVKFTRAEDLNMHDRPLDAAVPLEDAFSYLHDALDYIREATRKVPEVKKIRPGVK